MDSFASGSFPEMDVRLVLDPPSPQLVSLLHELRLCTPLELRRCARSVRKLAADLPSFDSVWIDALVQGRKLTPYQASLLSSAEPHQIRLGSAVLVNRLGGGTDSETYLARSVTERNQFVVKRLFGEMSQTVDFQQRIRDMIVGCTGLAHPALAIPTRIESTPRGLLVHSRFIPGFDLGELLIRRGRYPAKVVGEIALQLFEGLGILHRRGLVHGEIRLENIRLTDAGQCTMVDVGIRAALTPELIPHANIQPEAYDTTAPELIATGRNPDSRSDLYAVGCVLWQLLAGRPPFAAGDPLAKLVAHQTRRIGDIRDWAPDTPQPLAELIRDLTDPDPAERPGSTEEAFARLPSSPRRGTKSLARFLARFKVPSAGGSVDDSEVRVHIQTWVMLLMFIGIGLSVIISDHDSRLTLASFVADAVGLGPKTRSDPNPAGITTDALRSELEADFATSESGPEGEFAAKREYQELPEPDQNGVVILTETGPYAAREFHNVVGPLTIRSVHRDRSRIIVLTDRTPLSVSATDLLLENVVLEFSPEAERTGKGLLLKVRAQSVSSVRSRFMISHPEAADASSPGGRVAIAWMGIDSHAGGNRLHIEDSEFLGEGQAIHVDGRIHRLELSNVLKTGTGALCNIAPETETTLKSIHLDRVTCREATSLVRCQGKWLEALGTSRRKLTIELNDCVISLIPQRGAFLEMISSELPVRWNQLLEIIGENSISQKGVQLAQWRRSPNDAPEVPPGTDDLLIEGLLTTETTFSGPSLFEPSDSRVETRQGIPLTSASSIRGYRPARFPATADKESLNAN